MVRVEFDKVHFNVSISALRPLNDYLAIGVEINIEAISIPVGR